METVFFSVSVPICSFRKGYAREYLETEEIPPPSTIYGFLLSLIGEENRDKYIGTEIAYCILEEARISLLLRTTWRVKDKKKHPGVGSNATPDYQQILTGLKIAVWVKDGELSRAIQKLYESPSSTNRFGGLCLGESHDLINDIHWFPSWNQEKGLWLSNHPEGDFSLPIWVDHVGSEGTIWRHYKLCEDELKLPKQDSSYWITIQSNEGV